MFDEVIAFIRSLYGDGRVFLHEPHFGGNEKKYLNECIDSTFVSSIGPFVERFEHDMAAYAGVARAVVCVNGTNALHMALLLSGVERDDEVITQPLTFIATCNAISYIGAHPVFIDVDEDTLGLSPLKLRVWLKEYADIDGGHCVNRKTGRRIKACVPMHTFGHPVKMDELMSVCREFGIAVVEDAAEAIGSFYRNRHLGGFAPVSALSFNGNKTITTGGGGMLLFQDPELGACAKHLTTQAKVPHRWEFVHDHIGYNYRMPNINAALGCAQLEQIDKMLAVKRQTAAAYQRFFSERSDFRFVVEPQGARSNYWLNAVLLPNRAARDAFLLTTNDAGIATRPVWELMNRLPMFEQCERGDLSVAERISDCLVNLPSGIRRTLSVAKAEGV